MIINYYKFKNNSEFDLSYSILQNIDFIQFAFMTLNVIIKIILTNNILK